MGERKKMSWWFWIALPLIVVALYLAAVGPWIWIDRHYGEDIPDPVRVAVGSFFAPTFTVMDHSPTWFARPYFVYLMRCGLRIGLDVY